jgi:hypothetical protein
MKKNCFLYTVFLGTIVLGSAIYFFQNHFSELFFEEGKKIVVSQIEKNWDRDLNYVKNSIEKDSLRTLVKEFIMKFKDADELILTSSNAEDFVETVSSSFDDSLITPNELKMLSDLFLKVKNEKFKSD